MKRYMSLLLIGVLLLSLTACGKPLKVDQNTIYVQKKGKIISAIVDRKSTRLNSSHA